MGYSSKGYGRNDGTEDPTGELRGSELMFLVVDPESPWVIGLVFVFLLGPTILPLSTSVLGLAGT